VVALLFLDILQHERLQHFILSASCGISTFISYVQNCSCFLPPCFQENWAAVNYFMLQEKWAWKPNVSHIMIESLRRTQHICVNKLHSVMATAWHRPWVLTWRQMIMMTTFSWLHCNKLFKRKTCMWIYYCFSCVNNALLHYTCSSNGQCHTMSFLQGLDIKHF